MIDTDTLTHLFRRLSGGDADWWVTLFELLLIGASVNWCAGVLHGTRGTRPLRGMLIVLVVATLAVRVLSARMGWVRLELLYRYFIFGLAFVALVAFQPELRRAFIRAGDVRFLRRGTPQSKVVAALVKAAGDLSRNRYGALIAIERSVDLRGWAENGTIINAEVSASLLNTIFFPNSPLHDLGVIIKGRRALAANCQFPQAESDEVDAALGSRHLAAIGMSYESDALVLVVSEETGTVSLADNGQLTRFLSLDDLADELTNRLGGQVAPAAGKAAGGRRLSKTWRITRRALVVVPLTLVIWYLADQATQRSGDAELQVTIKPHDPVIHIEPRSVRFSVTFGGSTRAVERLQSDTKERPLEVEWSLPESYSRSARHTIPAKDMIEDLADIRARGLSVERVSPEMLTLTADRLETVSMPLLADTGRIKVAELRFDPPEVDVTLPSRQLEGIPQNDRHVAVRLEERLEGISPGELRSFEDVPVEPRVGERRAVKIEPTRVSVTLRVMGQTEKRRLSNIRVWLTGSPQVLEQYRIEQRDPNEWLVELELEGDKSVVESLRPQDIRAVVRITSDLAVPTAEFRNVEVEVVLPPGVTLVGPPRSVWLRVVEREAVTP
jgi:diadenylate cyclase